MKRDKIVRVIETIQHHNHHLRQLEIVLTTEGSIIVGASTSCKVREVEGELKANLTHISGTAIGDYTVLNGFEN
jgi:hypothetical protein